MFTMLPPATGPYKVGLSSLVRDLPPRSVGSAKLGDGSTVLDMDAVVWNVFYPCDARGATCGSAWIDQPYKASVSGISKFTGLSKFAVGPITWLYGMRLQMPVYQNAPLLEHENGRPWRLVIFSHGLAGSKTMYSQFCSELASQGFIVLAVEHRDRSGMLVTSRAGEHKLYVAPAELDWDEPDPTQLLLRVEQLEFRRIEIYEIFKAFRGIVSGDASGVHYLNGGPIDAAAWRGRVECDKDVVLSGHSFGGCTMLSVLSNPPPKTHDPLPLSHALALDPWFQPLSTPGPMPSSFSPDIPLCMMFSERFALWKDHHATAEALVSSWPAKASIFAFPKCSHETFSDVYCIVPFSGKTFGIIFRTIMDISHSFLEDRLDVEVDKRQSVPWKIISEKKKDTTIRKLDGVAGSIVIP